MPSYRSSRGPMPDRPTLDAFLSYARSLPLTPRRYQARAFDAMRRQYCPADAIYVGRACWGWKGSPWANPYSVEEYGRAEALRLFAVYASERATREPDWLAPLSGCPGIICWCKPGDACHGDLIIRLLQQGATDA